MSEKKRALVLASFRDAGTGESYGAGEIALLPAAIYANYQAGGLVGAPPAAKKPAAKPKPAPRRTGKAKAKPAPATEAAPAPSPAPEPVTDPAPAATAPDGDADA